MAASALGKETMPRAIGEVLSSSITGLIAQTWQKDGQDGLGQSYRPNFGSFLKVDSQDDGLHVFAIVYNIITGPQDNNHQPSALGLSREQLKMEQPHIFALLKTEIHALIIGYAVNGVTFPNLPPRPPQVHDFVFPAGDKEIETITSSMDFLRLISSVSTVPADELLGAAVREAYRARGNDHAFLIAAGQALSHLYRDDYDRLVATLRKLRPTT